jgi:UDP-2-acetamido-3-amino-2,3-dideoxy-glucuronate N-acetyltransferase
MSKFEDGQNPGIPYEDRKTDRKFPEGTTKGEDSYPRYDLMLDYWDQTDKVPPASIAPYAIVEPSATFGKDVIVGPWTHVMQDSRIGDGTLLEGCFIEGAIIGRNSRIYRNTHIMTKAVIGDNCLIGQTCFIADGAVIGNNVRMMMNVGVGRCTRIGNDVYLGPNVCFANSDNTGQIRSVEIGDGAWIGTNVVSTHNVRRVGKHAVVGAGTVLTKDVPDYAVVVGNPGKIIRYNTVDGLPADIRKAVAELWERS